MKKHLALAVALAVAPFAVYADEISYTYVEGGYAQLNQDAPLIENGVELDDIEAAGFFIGGSAAVSDDFHVFGGYRSGNDDVRVTVFGVDAGDIDTDLSQFNIGFGYHHSISDRTDLVTELSYISTEVDAEGGGESSSSDGDDVRVSVGVRHMMADSFEGWIKGHYSDGDFYDGTFSASLGGQFKFNPTWGVVGELEFGDDTSIFTIGARASF
ncbi:outer membrane beta-barrel protein [Lysobacter niastensis]|uniref:Outer membrane beta-barrel protein n=1 Tax=Lysobacter niastensis TaxID=380629 RepID=A0ABS0B438_9GAMM|nr:outer membrane beta-barrel protein [Lysobacter niastensis]MBF6023102.1 outer membrane beta-barrel protein [Lysobacter niastensis]